MSDEPTLERRSGSRLFSVAQIQHILRVEFGRAQRYRYPVACLAIAIDRLEALRDARGYEAKEEAVGGIVGLLRELTRASDFLGRTADDRLVCVIPHTDAAGARTLADRLLTGARALPGRPAGSTAESPMTLSIGTASADASSSMFHDALLSWAEDALSDAIASGGNRVVERGAPAAGA